MQVNKTLENPCQSAMDEYTNKWITKKKINKRWNFIQYVFLYCNIQTRTISNERHIHTKWNPFLNTDIIKRLVKNKQQKTTSMMLTFFLPFTHMQSFVELCLGFRSFRFHASLFRRCMAIGIGSKAPDESNIFLICFMIFRRLYLISREKKKFHLWFVTKLNETHPPPVVVRGQRLRSRTRRSPTKQQLQYTLNYKICNTSESRFF